MAHGVEKMARTEKILATSKEKDIFGIQNGSPKVKRTKMTHFGSQIYLMFLHKTYFLLALFTKMDSDDSPSTNTESLILGTPCHLREPFFHA